MFEDILENPQARATLALATVCDELIAEILRYDSDTFSALGVELTLQEATAMAAMLIKRRVSPGNNVDGQAFSRYLAEIRGE